MILPNYALAVLLFAIIIKIVLFPLGIKQQKNMVKQAQLKPKDAAIRKRYAGRTDKATQAKLNEEIMKLYQQEHFNPMGGCLPLLVEFPIIIALYNIIQSPLRYISSLSADVVTSLVNKATELAGAERALTQIATISQIQSNFGAFKDLLPQGFAVESLPNFNVFGVIDLSATPKIGFSWLLIIPILAFVGQFISMKLIRKLSYTPEQTGDAGKSMKILDYTGPLISLWIGFTVPAIIGLYWVYQSVIGIVRQFVLYKLYPYPTFTDEDFKNAEREMNGKMSKNERKELKKENATKVRSLHRIDEEDETDEEEDTDEKQGLIDKAELKDEDREDE
jgi:YidC/Oxa1 family membrane protein insertase